MGRRTRRGIARALVGACALVCAATASQAAAPGGAAQPQPSAAEQQSGALAASPGLDRAASNRYGSAAQERAAAQRATQRVPLPAGGNFNGVQWERTDSGLSVAEVE